MQSFAVGLSRIGEGVLGTVGSYFSKTEGEDNKETKKENPRRNIEYIDEVSTGLYPDLHYSEIVGTHKAHDEDDFLLLENTEVPPPSCPYYYVPFNQSVDMCNTFIRNWLQTIWFLPADWKTTLKILPGRPCLVPFYVFDVKTHSQIEAEVQIDGENGTKQWKSIADSVSSEYREMITCASRSVNQKLIDKLLYSEEHGFSFHSHLVLPAQLYPYPPQTDAITVIPDENVFSIDISKEEAWELSKLKIEDDEKQKSQNKITSPNIHSFRNIAVDTEYDSHNSVVYLPIYFASYEYTGQIYEVLVSGNKGVVVGSSIRERPIGTGSGGKFIMDKLKSLSNLVTDTVPM